MPSDVNQLTAGRKLTSLRKVLDCPATTTRLRQGPDVEPGADRFPVPRTRRSPARLVRHHHGRRQPVRLACGTVMDLRPTEQVLQSHADLWLTP